MSFCKNTQICRHPGLESSLQQLQQGLLGGLAVGALLSGCGCQNRFGIPFWLVDEFTTHFRTYVSGERGMFTGVRDFDPWPIHSVPKTSSEGIG